MIIGIDPGASGAICFLDIERGEIDVIDMPTTTVERNGKAKREISPAMLHAILASRKATACYIERVGAMPGQGSSSMFQFGRSVGMVEGVVAALEIPTFYVSPQVWQKAAGVRGGKDGARQRAAELFPRAATFFARVKDNGRADAALIAWYGATR